MEVRAVIFDLDGVIVDTAEHHYLAWKRLAQELGIPCPPERKDQVRGLSRRRSLEIVLGDYKVSEEDAEKLMAKKDSYYRELIQGLCPADVLPGVKDLLLDLRQNGIKVAVATVSKNARDVLSRLGILAEFDAIVDGHSDARSKPEPDLFLYAARKLGVSPAECLVVEDAPAGIEAAEAAGMRRVAVGPKERFSEVKADLIVPSLAGLTYTKLIELLSHEEERIRTWLVEETNFDPTAIARNETIFTVGNGYLGTRGSLEETYPGEIRATLIQGVYDDVPVFHTELVNVPDWTNFQLAIEGELFSLREGETLAHKRWLDLRDGILRRLLRWRSPNGRTVEIHTSRFASMADPHLCVQTYAITPLDFAGEIEIKFGFFLPPENPGLPPVPEVGLSHWKPVSQGFPDGQMLFLDLMTRRTKQKLSMAMGFLVSGIQNPKISQLDVPGHPGFAVRVRLEPKETAVLTKFVTLYTGEDAEAPGREAILNLRDAMEKGYAQILRDHRAIWRKLWENSDVVIEGDEAAQQAVRFNLYHLLIAAPRTERASIPAKALSGFGYRGHVFWDTDLFMLPFFTFTQPHLARRILAYRYHTLPGARENASKRGFRGAMYAWESAQDGRETTPRWVEQDGNLISILTGEQEHHITADVSYAVWQYWRATGDDQFMRDYGSEIVISAAQFWASRVERDATGYVIRQVIGPDEYHTGVNNNAYTNWLARWNLEAAVKIWDWLSAEFPDRAAALARKLGLSEGEIQRWKEIAAHMFFPFHEKTGLIEQFDGYFSLEDIDLAALEPRSCSVWDLLGPERTNNCQVIKQPDVLMLFHLFPEEFSPSVVKANWDYYEPRTDHRFGSSLGPAIHAALAARLGELEKAYSYFMQAALVDLWDLRGNTRDGIHAASAGGLWQALAFGFAGIRFAEEGPVAWPRLPQHWRRLALTICWRGKRFSFVLTPEMRGPVQPAAVSLAEQD